MASPVIEYHSPGQTAPVCSSVTRLAYVGVMLALLWLLELPVVILCATSATPGSVAIPFAQTALFTPVVGVAVAVAACWRISASEGRYRGYGWACAGLMCNLVIVLIEFGLYFSAWLT